MLEYIDIDIFINYLITKLTLTNLKNVKNSNWAYNRYIKKLVKIYDIKLIKSLTLQNISSYIKTYKKTLTYELLTLYIKTDTNTPLTYILKNKKMLTPYGGNNITITSPSFSVELYHEEYNPLNVNTLQFLNDIKRDICICCNITKEQYDENYTSIKFIKSITNSKGQLHANIVFKNNHKFPILTKDGNNIYFQDINQLDFKNLNIIFKLDKILIRKNKIRIKRDYKAMEQPEFDITIDTIYPHFNIIAVEVLEPIKLTFSKQIHNKINNKLVRERIIDSIKELDITFPEILEACKAMITGSYLLQVVNNVYYETDIDIFCPTKYVFYLLSCLSKLLSPKQMIIERCTSFRNNYSLQKIQSVIDIKFNGKLIQIIAINDNNISDYIDNYFDFSFCKIRSDGTNIYPNDLSDIYNKVGTFELNANNYKPSIVRINKYGDRGYKFNYTVNGVLLNEV
jgi:hypothetical protein